MDGYGRASIGDKVKLRASYTVDNILITSDFDESKGIKVCLTSSEGLPRLVVNYSIFLKMFKKEEEQEEKEMECNDCKYSHLDETESPCCICVNAHLEGESVSYPNMFEPKEEKEKEDVINHPKHYCREDAIECIDEMLLIFGEEAVMHFCLCNAWKYRYRAADKNGEEDLKKSDWYLRKYKELKTKSRERYLG